MTNTKFRRRALISSVAMLLVALVALGSATFAWFTENPVVSASGINASGTASMGLKITTDSQGTSNWADTATLMTTSTIASGKTMNLIPAYVHPVTSGETHSVEWYSTKAANALTSDPAITGDNKAKWTQLGSSDFVTVSSTAGGNNLGTGVYHEKVYIKTDGDSENRDADIDLTGCTVLPVSENKKIKTGVTVAIVVDGKLKAVYKPEDAVDVRTWASPSNGGNVTAYDQTAGYSTNPSGAISLGKAGDDTTGHAKLTVDVYVYLDGTDPDVKTSQADATKLLQSVSLNFAKHVVGS